jgi:hypothetical protein
VIWRAESESGSSTAKVEPSDAPRFGLDTPAVRFDDGANEREAKT